MTFYLAKENIVFESVKKKYWRFLLFYFGYEYKISCICSVDISFVITS